MLYSLVSKSAVKITYGKTLLCFREYYVRGRVSKLFTNGSKTALKDVIGFICGSLSSSTVRLHDSVGSRCACAFSEAGFSSQNDGSA
jgi:hypothetical protein